MAKVVDLNIDPALEDLMLKSVKTKKRYYSNSIIDRKIANSGRQYKKLEEQSHMSYVALLWNALSETKKSAWNAAAENCDLNGWQLFLQDTSYRIRVNLPGIATPSLLTQYMVLGAYIPPDNEDFFFSQVHYTDYSVSIKNVGQKNARTFTEIEEVMTAPFLFEFSYLAALEDTDVSYDFYVEISFYGTKDGVGAGDTFQFELDMQTNWQAFSEEITPDLDTVTTYEVSIMGEYVTGVILFDNFNFEHNSENWAFDPFCNHYDRYYYYILSSYVRSWDQDISGTDPFFGTIYHYLNP